MHNKIITEMNSHGLQRVSESIAQNIRNAIILSTLQKKEDSIPLGGTKIGGRPDVPADFVWPRCDSGYLSFIAQINLEETKEYDVDKLLPGSGILYFFYDANQEVWGYDPKDVGSWKVIYYDGDMDGLTRAGFPESIPAESRFKSCPVKLISGMSLPAWESGYIEELNLNEAEQDAYDEFYEEQCPGSNCIHKLLGHPDQIQGDMQLECQLVSNGLYCGDSTGYEDPRAWELEKGKKDLRLLLQIDSDDNCEMMWGDGGRLYFWIRDDDLANRRFEKVWVLLQCY